MAKAEASVEELVGMIEQGELQLPEMQRQYVWRAPRVRDLLDSLYRGYPSGAILVWETDEEIEVRSFAVKQKRSPYASRKLLLDGQQRLTSLSAVIRGEQVEVRNRKKPIDMLFNLEHPDELTFVTEVNEEEDDGEDGDEDDEDADASVDEIQQRLDRMTFVVATKKLQGLPHWVKVSEVFSTDEDAPFLERASIEKISDPRYRRYSNRLAKVRAIRDYVYRIDVLERGLKYEEVTEIFVRVNSLGAKLRSSDLALAQITAKWPKSLKEFTKFQDKIQKTGFDLDLGIHLKNLVIFATGQSRFRTIGNVRIERLKKAWKDCQKGMEFAVNFLRSNMGVDSPTLLASPFLILAIAAYGDQYNYRLGAKQAEQLRFWALLANAKGRYSRGASETILDQDIAAIRKGATPSALVDRLRQQVGRLETTADELENRNQRSALFKTMFLAFRELGAKDWETRIGISLKHVGQQHRLEFHHIFPQAVLRGHYPPKEINDIANLAFISAETNKAISAKQPKIYFKGYTATPASRKSFAAQGIPTTASLLEIKDYHKFLAARRDEIARIINAFLGV